MSTPKLSFDQAACQRFLSMLMVPPMGCTELRVFHAAFDRGGFVTSAQQYSRTLSGWYDDASRLIVDASRLRGISGYVTINPVNSILLSRADSKLIKAKHATTDVDIACLRWLYVDIDPIRPADVSSTDAELAAAISRRDAILGDHPDFLASAMWGRSGNGTWILARLPDVPNDPAHVEMIGKTLAALSARYSDKVVSIDVKTKNPSRVACLPGTPKCKGSNRPERPWRMVTIDTPEPQPDTH